eukprot:3477303-Prymnesium_polylepis.1
MAPGATLGTAELSRAFARYSIIGAHLHSPCEHPELEELSHRPPQQVRVRAFARVGLPIQRAARDAQHDVEHDGASHGM